MSDYTYRAYSPSKSNQSPTRRHPIIPPAGSAIGGGRYGGAPGAPAGLGDGFEGWYDGSLSYTKPQSATQSTHSLPPSLQPARGSSASRRDYDREYDRDSDLAFGSEPTAKRGSLYSTGTPDRGRESTYRRRVRTPSTSSTESIPRSRDRRSSRQDRQRTPSISPPRSIGATARDGSQRTPSGNIMNSLFTAENAAAVGGALGSAASFLGTRAGLINKPEQRESEYDSTPGGFNNRPVPDTVNQNNGFNLGNAMDYLQHFTAPQTPPATSPPQQQPGGSPFTLSNALNYLQQTTQPQPNNSSGGIPQRFQLAGIDIDMNWIARKASEQNPWVLLGGAVVAFWIISSIIATLIWYGVIAGILYVVYIVGVKNGGFSAISGSPDKRRVGGASGTGRAGSTGTGARRRY